MGADSAAHGAWARVLELDPSRYSAYDESAVAYAASGKPAQAMAEILKQPESGLTASALGNRAFVFAKLGRRSEAEKIVRELQGSHAERGTTLGAIGYAYLALGDLDRAMDGFIRAPRTHDLTSPFTPDYEPIRTHPRYSELLRAMDLQDQPIAKFKVKRN